MIDEFLLAKPVIRRGRDEGFNTKSSVQMKISAKAEYACIAMLELAARYQKKVPVSIKVIAETYDISAAFLMQIFMQLRGAGLLSSVRGSAGGFLLARAPEKINLEEIIEVIDGPQASSSALTSLPGSALVRILQNIWQEVEESEKVILREHTLVEILNQVPMGETFVYEI